jgi:predicted alpha/beta hydrolase family esterase
MREITAIKGQKILVSHRLSIMVCSVLVTGTVTKRITGATTVAKRHAKIGKIVHASNFDLDDLS